MSVETYDYVEHTAIVQSTDPVRNIDRKSTRLNSSHR